jgi:hypothetical protein
MGIFNTKEIEEEPKQYQCFKKSNTSTNFLAVPILFNSILYIFLFNKLYFR